MSRFNASRFAFQLVTAGGLAGLLVAVACGEIAEGPKCPAGKTSCDGVCAIEDDFDGFAGEELDE